MPSLSTASTRSKKSCFRCARFKPNLISSGADWPSSGGSRSSPENFTTTITKPTTTIAAPRPPRTKTSTGGFFACLRAGARARVGRAGGPLPPADHDGPVLRGLVSRKSPRKSLLPAACPGRQRRRPRGGRLGSGVAPGATNGGLAMGTHHALARQLRAEGHLAITVGARNGFSHDKIQRLGGRLFRQTRGHNCLSINHAAALEKPRAQGRHPHRRGSSEFRLPNSEFLTTATAGRLAPKRCNC